CAQAEDWRSAKSIYDFHALDIDGNDVSLEKYRDRVCIVTNVASK
ncbi:GPX4 peroxidase, partial [Cephalopterus ornatus]|nr:GPX4 peroxidase [Cephalopterus ornatus]